MLFTFKQELFSHILHSLIHSFNAKVCTLFIHLRGGMDEREKYIEEKSRFLFLTFRRKVSSSSSSSNGRAFRSKRFNEEDLEINIVASEWSRVA
jgi:hypothetical protein